MQNITELFLSENSTTFTRWWGKYLLKCTKHKENVSRNKKAVVPEHATTWARCWEKHLSIHWQHKQSGSRQGKIVLL